MPNLDELLATLEGIGDLKRFNKLQYYQPYPKQIELHNLDKRERMLRAGNQLGKTYCAAAEIAMHLTGQYPNWYKGHRFTKPVKVWAACESSVLTRDRTQSLLCGPYGVPAEQGSGFIPRDCILDYSLSRGVTDAFDTVMVRHRTGGVSSVSFKSYEQGRKKFQSDAIDFVGLDEEPPYDIYTECLTRTTATQGLILTTFTPLQGRTPLLTRFMDEKSPERAEVVMTIYDVPHIKDLQTEINKYPVHERQARAMGVPMMGEGRIFPFSDESISEDPIFRIPPEWTRLWGIDFGSGADAHPFAAALVLWDRENDCLHVHAAVKTSDPLVSHQVALMKPIASSVKVAWPHDGNSRERGAADETTTTALLYKKAGLRMLPTHATFADGGISTEAGVNEMYQRMIAGKLKVAKHLIEGDWGNEFRSYHRKDGLIVKVNDDLMSATRMVVMAKARGDTSPLGPQLFTGVDIRPPSQFAEGVDFDVFSA